MAYDTQTETKLTAAEYSHRAVWPLLMADKVVGSEHHLADVAVEACFMPVLTHEKKRERQFTSIRSPG